MPTYNAERTVAVAVSSTLKALTAVDRLYVRDDASTDGTVAIIKQHADPRLVLIEGEENLGVAGGLNRLLEQVRTPLVARMDADDVCLPWRFHWCKKQMSGVDVLFTSSAAMTDDRALTTRNIPFPISTELFAMHLLIANPVTHSTMLGWTDIIRQTGAYRVTVAEDYDLWLRLILSGRRLRRLALPTLRYRYHPGQLTAGATWLERLLQDRPLAESYDAVAHKTLGSQAFWLRDLMCAWSGDGPPSDSLRHFGQLVRAASVARGPNKLLLERRLRKFGL